MKSANVSNESTYGLPTPLRTAQAAIHLPEVQTMLRRLSAFELGIFMPHRHDERTGEFQPLPDEMTQVESGLEVSFQSTAQIAAQNGRFLPVSWIWRAGASTPSAVCEMAQEKGPGGTERSVKHKMPDPD